LNQAKARENNIGAIAREWQMTRTRKRENTSLRIRSEMTRQCNFDDGSISHAALLKNYENS